MKFNKIIYFFLALFLFNACVKEEAVVLTTTDEDSFFLKNDAAIMPVLVKGNTASKIFCITLHGGPGDSGIQSFSKSGVLSAVEKEFAIVSYDQRCAGLSQGNCNPEQLEVTDFVADIDKLITLLRFKYGNDISFFLYGHSWGATLGADYLIHGKLKDAIKGYIHSNGSHNIPKLIGEEIKFMLHHATQQIELGKNTEAWQKVISTIENSDTSTIEGKVTIVQQADQLETLFIDVDSVQASTLQFDKLGQELANSFITLTNASINQKPFLENLFAYNVSNQLSNITTPTAIYWGWFDAIHPPVMAEDFYAKIGATQKELFYFRKSFHSPMANENEAFQEKIIEFIHRYK